MVSLSPRARELLLYYFGAILAVSCNTVSQWLLLERFCSGSRPLCRLAVIAISVAASFCFKYSWDKFLVFPSSRTSETRKSVVFLLSSSFITSVYLVAMAAIAFSGASNNAIIQASWFLFLVGYLVKYMIDRRFAFGLG